MRIKSAIRAMIFLAIAVAASFASSGKAIAEKRVALVIGNSAYSKFRPLKNSVNDAHAVAEALKRAGFDLVQTETDVNSREFYAALSVFSDRAVTADAVVFYYAGHGVEEGHTGYFLPVDVDPADIRHIEFSTAPTTDVVLRALQRSLAPKIVIIDACRTDPTAREIVVGDLSIRTVSTRNGSGSGDERRAGDIRRDAGMLVVYSTASDQVAYDGVGENSPFAEAFVKRLFDSSLSVTDMFHAVASDVDQATDHHQRTNFTDSLVETFRLNIGENDALDWERIRKSINPDDFNTFIKRHPASAHAADAEWKRDVLLQAQHDNEVYQQAKAAAAKAEAEKAAQEESCKNEDGKLTNLAAARDEAGMARLRAGGACRSLSPAIDKALAELHRALGTEACEAERRRIDAAGADFDALRGALIGLSCEAMRAEGRSRLALAEEARRREKDAAEKAVAEACRRETNQIGRIVGMRDESGLAALRDGAQCKMLAPSIDKAFADIRSAKAVIACSAERRQVEASGNSLDALRGALAGLSCDAVRAEAQIRIGKLEDAQRALAAEQAEAATCKQEADLLTRLKAEGGEPGLEALRNEASCANLRPMTEKVIAEVRAAKASAACDAERRGMEAAKSDLDALRGALEGMSCAPVRADAQARLAKLEEAQRVAAATAICQRENEALSKMTADEDETGVSRLRDNGVCAAIKPLAVKAIAQIASAKAKADCESDRRALDLSRNDAAALHDAFDKMTCHSVKMVAAAQIAKLDSDRKLAEIAHEKCESAKDRLEKIDPSVQSARDELVMLRDKGSCSDLRGDIDAKLESVAKQIRDVQNSLARIGCYRRAPSGVFDNATKQSIEVYFLGAHSVGRETRVSLDLLSELEGRDDPKFCAPPASPPGVATGKNPSARPAATGQNAARPAGPAQTQPKVARQRKQPSGDQEAIAPSPQKRQVEQTTVQPVVRNRSKQAKAATVESAMSRPSTSLAPMILP